MVKLINIQGLSEDQEKQLALDVASFSNDLLEYLMKHFQGKGDALSAAVTLAGSARAISRFIGFTASMTPAERKDAIDAYREGCKKFYEFLLDNEMESVADARKFYEQYCKGQK